MDMHSDFFKRLRLCLSYSGGSFQLPNGSKMLPPLWSLAPNP